MLVGLMAKPYHSLLLFRNYQQCVFIDLRLVTGIKRALSTQVCNCAKPVHWSGLYRAVLKFTTMLTAGLECPTNKVSDSLSHYELQLNSR